MENGFFFHLWRYLGEVGVEIKKTTWPQKAEWIASTQVVLGTVLVAGLYMALIDAILTLFTQQLGLGK